MRSMTLVSGLLLIGCGVTSHGGVQGSGADLATTMQGNSDLAGIHIPADAAAVDLATDDQAQSPDDGGNLEQGCGGAKGCYTVFAHSDHVLYNIDLANKMLVQVGAFKAPKVLVSGQMVEDVITDLAVAPDGTIWVISKTTLYTADAKDGHVTVAGSVGACGTEAVALTFTPDGNLYAADFMGAFCKIDPMTKKVTQVGNIGGGMAIAGDLVAVKDGTVYGTAYKLADGSKGPTALNNLLVKINPANGQATQVIGSTGFPKMFGVAYAQAQVFGFTHDGTGAVATIDPMTGKGTLFNTFLDPMTGKGISFAGAGVNPLVSPSLTH